MKLLSDDKNMAPDEANWLTSGQKLKALSMEELQQLALQAQATYMGIMQDISRIMSTDLAMRVKRLRMVRKLSWRAVAAAIHDEYMITERKAFWNPPNNQLAGMALCEQAGQLLNETID